METRENTSLSITELGGGQGGQTGDRPPREHVPTGTYEGAYHGLRVRMKKTKPEWGNNGEQKVVNLMFKITKGPHKDKVTSYEGRMLYVKSTSNWIVASKGDLAEQIRVITNGSGTIDDSHKGQLFIIEVEAKKMKPRPGDTGDRYWDEVKKILRHPDGYVKNEVTPAQPSTTTAVNAAPAPAKPAAAAPKSDDLLDDLTSLGDFGA